MSTNIFALVYGQVVTPPKIGTSAKGTQYARILIRTGDGDGAMFISATIFDSDSIDAVEKLAKGDAVALSGAFRVEPYLKDGTERMGYALFAARALTAAKPVKKRKPRPVGSGDDESFFGEEAGAL